MNKHSEVRLSKVHPELARRVRLVIADCAKQGISLEVVQGLRTHDEQNALYAQGRTSPGKIVTNAKGGQSNHNYGLAVDLCPFLNDTLPNWNAPESTWKAIGKTAERYGLEWGGRWKFRDMPHVELQGLSVRDCQSLFRQGGLKLVWERASASRAAIEGQVAQNGDGERPTQTAAVSIPFTPPPVSIPQAEQSASPLHFAQNWLVTLRKALPLTSLVSAGGSSFWLQYRWPLLAVAACAFCFWLGWHLRPPKEKIV